MFANVRPDPIRTGFFEADVSDLNGRFHTLGGVWAKDIDGAHIRFEKIALDWDSYDAPSDEEMADRTIALLREIAIWGCE